METKMIRVPFSVELAKQIQDKEIEGKIVDTYYHCGARIVDFNFNTLKGKFIIIVSERNGDNEVYAICNEKGIIYLDKEEKYEDKPCFVLEVPEYTQFKDGDVYKTESGSISIYNGNYKAIAGLMPFYVGLRKVDKKLIFHKDGEKVGFGTLEECTLDVTEKERQQLIDALKQSTDPRAKDCLKKLGIEEEKPKYEFKPFDKVLVRDSILHKWEIDFFKKKIYSEECGNEYGCLLDNWKYCIPYNEQTAYLFDTTANP